MRILIQECKKMLSVRLLLLLALFTVLFYNMFFELNLYPAGGQCTDSPYDMPYAAKLIRKYGSTLPVTEKGKIEKEVEDLKKSHEYHKSLGYEVDELGGLEGVATFYFMKDPDGFNIEIIGK